MSLAIFSRLIKKDSPLEFFTSVSPLFPLFVFGAGVGGAGGVGVGVAGVLLATCVVSLGWIGCAFNRSALAFILSSALKRAALRWLSFFKRSLRESAWRLPPNWKLTYTPTVLPKLGIFAAIPFSYSPPTLIISLILKPIPTKAPYFWV